jgi:hypothetical protein
MANKFEADGYVNHYGNAWVIMRLYDRVQVALPSSEVAELIGILQRALAEAEAEARCDVATEQNP